MNENILTSMTEPVFLARRNHALEHATFNILAHRGFTNPLAGYSDSHGFWVLGDIKTETLKEAVVIAHQRLLKGERGLAIHTHCGTNYAAAGALAGLAAWLGMLGTESGWRRKVDRLPLVMALATFAFMISEPLGPYLQRRVTTDSELGNLEVKSITRYQRGKLIFHQVQTYPRTNLREIA